MNRLKKNKLKDPFAEREASNYANPIPSRELISQVLEKSSGPMDYKKLCKVLQINGDQAKEALRRRLNAMERDGQLATNRRREYGLTNKMDLVRGRVQGHRDGFGFVIPTDGSADIHLSNRQMRKVFDGDEVLARPSPEDFKGRREGKIVEVLSHNTHQLVGRYLNQGGSHFVRPDNPRNSQDIIIPPEDTANAQAGQFVVVEVTQQPDRYQKPVGRIMEVLGDHMAPGMEIDVAIRSHGIPHTWPADVQQQTSFFTAEVKEEDKLNRIDLRHLPFVTIDGEDARDFDDAVYCERKRSGGWRLFVAIADVSHYVPSGSALDQEAMVRGNSVYFPDYVVPMLPQVLSNGLCSLNPKTDRLCMVCEMTISAAGKISGYKFYESVMHSHARLTYTQVGAFLANPKRQQKGDIAALTQHIDELYRLYLALRLTREARGAIDFETKETRIIFDEERKIHKIIPVERNEAHKLIEECMLAANVCAAKLLESLKIPTLYRVHEGPKAEKLEGLNEFLGELGLSMKGSGKVSPQDYRDVLAQVGERPDAHLIQTVMLRSMNQAQYQAENLGHFGLAYKAYAHFTSPIRRYPDLIVHRAIRALVRADIASNKVRRHPERALVPFSENYPYDTADMVSFGEQCSTTERRADEATRDVISWLKCEFLQERVGEEFDGVISAVTAFGLFVELSDLYVEGLIHITSLPQDYYHHEASQHRLVGERSRRVFRIGDQLRVQVARVDLDERKVDFELIKVKSKKRKGTNTLSDDMEPGYRKNSEIKLKSRRRVRKRPISDAASEGEVETVKQDQGKPQAVKAKVAAKAKKKTKATSSSKAKKSKKTKREKRRKTKSKNN